LNPFFGLSSAPAIDLVGESPEMFLNMVKVHALDGAFETIFGDIPDPDRPVRYNQDEFRLKQPPLKSLCI